MVCSVISKNLQCVGRYIFPKMTVYNTQSNILTLVMCVVVEIRKMKPYEITQIKWYSKAELIYPSQYL